MTEQCQDYKMKIWYYIHKKQHILRVVQKLSHVQQVMLVSKIIVWGASLDATFSSGWYDTYSEEIANAMSDMYEQRRPIMNWTVRRQYRKEGVLLDEEGILDVGVSLDGYWQTFKHRCRVCDWQFHMRCSRLRGKYKFCQRRALVSNKYKDDIHELSGKMAAHKLSGQCHKSYQVSSGGLKKACALDMWKKSQNKLFACMRYIRFICDGDSSAYNSVKDVESSSRDRHL